MPVLGDLPDNIPVQERAVLWALEYHVETVDADGRRRIRLASRHESDDHSEPPAVREVGADVVAVWEQLLALVEQPAAVARLRHLLFERGGADAGRHGKAAAAAYLAAAALWERRMDAVADLIAATRLARAVSDAALTAQSLEAIRELATAELATEEPAAGIVLRALTHLVREPGCGPDVDALLEQAAVRWDVTSGDKALALMLERAADREARSLLWRRRVAAFQADAESASSGVMRAVRLQQALRLAEQSGDLQIRDQAAAALQTVRRDDLELMSFSATSLRYEEEFEREVASLCKGNTWQAALVTFAATGPLSGDTDANRAIIRAQHAEHPLGALLPTQLLGPDGLPVYSGTTPEDRFDVDLTRWEALLLEHWLQVLSAALHSIPENYGLPPLADIAAFLEQWPAVAGGVAPALARALLRFWCGDSEGAAFTVVPRIESLARTLVRRNQRGVYRLQREHVPGQYAGLGALLPILAEEYGLTESDARFYSVVLRHPAGLNLRNQLAHGFLGDPGPGYAALLLHAALRIATIRPPDPAVG